MNIKSFFAVVLSTAALNADANTVVKGTVTTVSGEPLEAVAVSDGHTVALTDAKGRYALSSPLDLGYVFVSTPNGYEPAERLGNRPKFWTYVSTGNKKPVNFKLQKMAGDSALAIIAIADPQISDRCGDVERLHSIVVPNINRAIDSLRAEGASPIVMTLGDVVCDWFIANGYGYTLDRFNADFKVNAPVYHTMGNHDNDPFIEGDIPGASTWHKINGPSYYSFNRGGAHFIAVDNIIYENPGASQGKSGTRYSRTALTDEQLDWIAADLATVKDKDAPLFLTMHGIFLSFPVAEGDTLAKVIRMDDGGERLASLLQGFSNVKVLSGHAHNNHFQHTPDGSIREYNYAGACGTWWPASVTPYYPNYPICLDGAPWGMGVWNFTADPRNPSHRYEGFDMSPDAQMRVYDLNCMTVDDPSITKEYLPGDSANANVVLANIWGYEPGCRVRMWEDGRELEVKRVKAQDPLHFRLRAIPVKAALGKVPKALVPESTAHMFRARTTHPDTPVTVEFTDLTGNTFTQTLIRPAAPED